MYILVQNKISQAMNKYYYEGPTFNLWRGSCGVPLLNFEGGPGVPTSRRPGSWGPVPTFTPYQRESNECVIYDFIGEIIWSGILYRDVTEFREETIYFFIFQLMIWVQITDNNQKQCHKKNMFITFGQQHRPVQFKDQIKSVITKSQNLRISEKGKKFVNLSELDIVLIFKYTMTKQ